MSETLLLLLGHSLVAPLRWCVLSNTRPVRWGETLSPEDFQGLRETAETVERVIALLPGEQVAARELATAVRSDQKLRLAAQFLLEDELAEPVVNLQVAVATSGGAQLAIGVRETIVSDWLAAFAAAEIKPDVLGVDYLTLPGTVSNPVAIFETGRIVVSAGPRGFAAEADLFPHVLKALAQAGAERIGYLGEPHDADLLADFPARERLGPADPEAIFKLYGDALADRETANLLQGRYRRKRSWKLPIGEWRRAAALALCALVLLPSAVAADAFRAERTAQRLKEAAAHVHGRAFPDMRSIDPVAHARSVLDETRRGKSFLELSSLYGAVLDETANVQIERIRYDALRSEFIVSLRSRSDADIEAVRSRLAQRGVIAEDFGGYRRSGSYWIGEVTTRLQ